MSEKTLVGWYYPFWVMGLG